MGIKVKSVMVPKCPFEHGRILIIYKCFFSFVQRRADAGYNIVQPWFRYCDILEARSLISCEGE